MTKNTNLSDRLDGPVAQVIEPTTAIASTILRSTQVSEPTCLVQFTSLTSTYPG